MRLPPMLIFEFLSSGLLTLWVESALALVRGLYHTHRTGASQQFCLFNRGNESDH